MAGKAPYKAERKIFFSALPLFKRLLKFLNELFRRVANNNDDCGSNEGFQGSISLTQAVLLTKQVMRYTYSAAVPKCVRNNGKTSQTYFRRKDENHYD